MNEIRFWRAVTSLSVIALTAYLLVHVWSIVIPFVLGFGLAYLVHPLVDRFVALGIRRDRVVMVLYVALLGVLVLLGFLLIPPLVREATEALQQIPRYTASFNELAEEVNSLGQEILKRVSGRRHFPDMLITVRAESMFEGLLTRIPDNILNVAHFGLWVFIIPFSSFFALSRGREWTDGLFNFTPSEYVESLLGFMAELNASLGGYIRGQVLEASCVGLLTMFGLWVLGFDGAVLVGFLSGLLNFVPFMAPVVGGSIALFLGYIEGLSAATLFGIFCLFVLVRLVDDFVLIPFIIGSSVQLPPVVMLFAILAGFEFGGILGGIFAVPIAAVVKVVLSIFIAGRRDQMLITGQKVLS